MFKIALSATYRIKIHVEIPAESGKIDKSDFTAEFKRCDLEKLDELRKEPQRDVIRAVLVGWDGLVDEDNNAVPFNEATREAVLAIPQAMFALIETFWSSVQTAKQKN
ncbi:hypothetical protein IP91_02576 [Pseudoduganella lurida]|uniref:Phage tail assembly chaperone n=1 Tax=Pseudoduganella lurida TaxID=1036180 RepID=A0A562R7X0_9BURK|nr:hypothetical protein [Pseudoduganella lurida]TWI65169.1 hypothetical protein IP91_02576 [Pseudoduganella lurida]